MSFGVGIGDICLILDGIITICKNASETKQILLAAQRDVSMLRSTVLLLRDEIGDERLFVKSGNTEVSTIRSSLKPLKNDVREIQEMLTSYTNPAPKFLDKVRYATLDKNRFDDLREKFTGHRINIIVILNLIISRRQKGQSSVLYQINENQTKSSLRQQDEIRKLRKSLENNGEKTSQSLEEILQLLKGDLSLPKASPKLDPQSILKQMEEHLAAKGVTGEAAREQLLPLKREIDRILDVGTTSHDSLKEESPREPAKQTPSPKSRLSTSSLPCRPPSTSRRSKSGIKGYSRILCVDENHGKISRTRVAHGTGEWIFKRVDSKGLYVNETIPPASVPSSEVHNITNSSRYSWANDYPNEVIRIVNRSKAQTVLKICHQDFVTYDFILCFTESTADAIRSLRADAASKHPDILARNTVKLLTSPSDTSGGQYLLSLPRGQLRSEMRKLIDNFRDEEFGNWYQAASVPSAARFRTLQFVMDLRNIPRGSKEHGYSLAEIPKVKEWEKETGCVIRITKMVGGEKCLISVIGPTGSHVGDNGSGINSLLHRVEGFFKERSS